MKPFHTRPGGVRAIRWVYTFFTYLLTPVILFRLSWRGIQSPEYFRRWKERFGFFEAPSATDCIWVHAVSLGEVNAAIPLIEELRKIYPGKPFVVTTVTPTGSDRVRWAFGDKVFHVYLPYDLPAAVNRFLDKVEPVLAIILETEIWPNLFCSCHDRQIPLIIANARLSRKSRLGYRPVMPLVNLALSCVSRVAAQTEADAARMVELGADESRIVVSGNLKYETHVPHGLEQEGQRIRSLWGNHRHVWVAASTHEGDEKPVLEALDRVLERFPSSVLVLVPRHPERFQRVAGFCRAKGYKVQLRSNGLQLEEETQIFIVDTMGELMKFYAASDLAFLGGSFAHIGGHNVLEAAALGKAVLVGPYTFNFEEITNLLIENNAGRRVYDAKQLAKQVIQLLENESQRNAMGHLGIQTVHQKRGALARIVKMINETMNAGQGMGSDSDL